MPIDCFVYFGDKLEWTPANLEVISEMSAASKAGDKRFCRWFDGDRVSFMLPDRDRLCGELGISIDSVCEKIFDLVLKLFERLRQLFGDGIGIGDDRGMLVKLNEFDGLRLFLRDGIGVEHLEDRREPDGLTLVLRLVNFGLSS